MDRPRPRDGSACLAGGRLLYKDPLQGNHLCRHSFQEMDSRIDPWLYYLTVGDADKLLTQLQAV